LAERQWLHCIFKITFSQGTFNLDQLARDSFGKLTRLKFLIRENSKKIEVFYKKAAISTLACLLGIFQFSTSSTHPEQH
jgi:hypothetical protein